MEQFIFNIIEYILSKNIFFVYGFFFLTSFIQMIFPPCPGDLILVFQGYLSIRGEAFSVISLLLLNMTATLAGSILVFKFGYKKGEKVFKNKIVKKYINRKHRIKATRLFEKHGYFAVLMSKFIPGVNAVIILFAGIFKVRPFQVYFSLFVSSLLHHIICLVLGRVIGYNIHNIKRALITYNGIVLVIVAVAALLYVFYRFRLYKSRSIAKKCRREKI